MFCSVPDAAAAVPQSAVHGAVGVHHVVPAHGLPPVLDLAARGGGVHPGHLGGGAGLVRGCRPVLPLAVQGGLRRRELAGRSTEPAQLPERRAPGLGVQVGPRTN